MEDSRTATAGVSTAAPNFLIIGAAKCGTTSLYNYLRQHPQVYMSPKKHTRFFAFDVENPDFNGPGPEIPPVPYAITDPDVYHAMFAGAYSETAVGEASHSYMYQTQAARRIKEYDPGMKLVAILRNPAERTYSHHRQMIRDGREPVADFERALREEEGRIREHWWPDFHYVQIGLYHEQLQRYFELFEHDQIRVYLYEDLSASPFAVLQDLFQFLEVDDEFVPETAIRYNASGVPRNRSLHWLLQRTRQVQPFVRRAVSESQYQRLLRLGSGLHNRNLTKPRISPEARKRVTDTYFRDDILKLQNLTGRDLSAWMA